MGPMGPRQTAVNHDASRNPGRDRPPLKAFTVTLPSRYSRCGRCRLVIKFAYLDGTDKHVVSTEC